MHWEPSHFSPFLPLLVLKSHPFKMPDVLPFLEYQSYKILNGNCPLQTLIFHNGYSWWIKIAVDWSLPEAIQNLGYLKEPSMFRQFIEAIDLSKLPLLDDTLTKIALSLTEQNQNSIMILVMAANVRNCNPYNLLTLSTL